MRSSSRAAYLLFAANILVWGYNWVPLHLLVERVPPAMLVAVRVTGGAITLLLALVLMRRPLTMPRSPWLVPVGLLQVSGMMGLSTFALLSGGVSRTTILVFTMPFWATIFSRLVLDERITKRKWAAIFIAVLGLAFIASHSSGKPAVLVGAGLSILAGACWAAGSVLAKKHLSGGDLLNGVMWQQLVGAVPLVILALVRHETPVTPSAGTLGLLAFATIVGTGLGWLLWANVLSRVSASAAALGSLGIPLVAAIAAFLQLGERPDSVTLTGLVAILVAIAISSWPVAKEKAPRDVRGAQAFTSEDVKRREPEPVRASPKAPD